MIILFYLLYYWAMYQVKNYLLSMQSHWMVNHTTYNAVQDTLPQIAKFKGAQGSVVSQKVL